MSESKNYGGLHPPEPHPPSYATGYQSYYYFPRSEAVATNFRLQASTKMRAATNRGRYKLTTTKLIDIASYLAVIFLCKVTVLQ